MFFSYELQMEWPFFYWVDFHTQRLSLHEECLHILRFFLFLSFTHTYTHKLTHWCVKSGWRWNSTYVLCKVRKEVHVSYFCLLYWICYYHIGPGCCFDSGLLVGKIVPTFLHKFWHFIYLSLLSSDDSVVWTGRVWACLSFSIVSSNKGGKLARIAK